MTGRLYIPCVIWNVFIIDTLHSHIQLLTILIEGKHHYNSKGARRLFVTLVKQAPKHREAPADHSIVLIISWEMKLLKPTFHWTHYFLLFSSCPVPSRSTLNVYTVSECLSCSSHADHTPFFACGNSEYISQDISEKLKNMGRRVCSAASGSSLLHFNYTLNISLSLLRV